MTRKLSFAFALAALAGACSSGPKTAGPTGPGGPGAAGASYDAVPLIDRELLFGNPDKVAPKLSPDGTRLSYLAPDNGVLNVFVRTVGKDDAKVVTSDRKRGVRNYFWSPDGQHILYLQDKDGDENWHVYAVSLADNATRDLTPVDGVQAQIIAVEREHPDHVLIGLNDRDPQLHDVYRVNIRSGERVLVQKNDIGAVGWIADHTLTVRAAQKLTPDGGAQVVHRASAKAAWKPLVTWSAEDLFTSGALGFAGDNQSLYVLSSAGSNAAELRTINVNTGAVTTLASDPTADVAELLAHPTTHAIQAVGFKRARTEWTALDPAIADDLEALRGLHPGDFQVVDRDDADKTWLVAYVQDKGPIVYFAYDHESKQGTKLFSHRPELEDLALAEMKPVSYQARDGLTIHGYLTLPAGVEPKNLPVVIHPHGGPWARDSWGFDPIAQWLANRGYAVLQPNFRGSTGYGKQFLNAANREWGGKMQDDITDGTQWLIDQGIADPERICIMGGSYGGYATLMGLVREPDMYACGVDIVGVANLITWMENIPPYWIPFRHVLHQRVGDPKTDAEFLKSRSPVFQADKIRSPLLIAQGANDPRVPRAESLQIRDAVAKAGKPAQYVEFPDEGHGFARPENRLEFFRIAEKFLAEHIGGRYQE